MEKEEKKVKCNILVINVFSEKLAVHKTTAWILRINCEDTSVNFNFGILLHDYYEEIWLGYWLYILLFLVCSHKKYDCNAMYFLLFQLMFA